MRDAVWFRMLSTCLACGLGLSQAQERSARDVSALIVVGAAGTQEYGALFAEQVKIWSQACDAAGVKMEVIGAADAATPPGDAEALEARLKAMAARREGALWLVLIGHGTFDGRAAKFNLRGPDVTPGQVAEWLKPLTGEIVIVHTGSASGAFLKPLTGPKRIVVTGTKSGDEVFYARFGQFFAPAIAGLTDADIDRDRQVSVLEAFLYSSKKVAEFYEQEGRIATEHALIDDNGDGVGTRPEVFEGTKAKEPKADGVRARQVCLVLSDDEARLTDAQRAVRDELERKLEELTAQRAKITNDEYYRQLEKLMRELSQVYRGT